MSKNNKIKKIGTISHISSTNKIIVPTKQIPKIGSLIVNKKQKPIGKINDIIGSTRNPYVSIKTNKKFYKAHVGEEVYLKPNNRKRRMRPRQAF